VTNRPQKYEQAIYSYIEVYASYEKLHKCCLHQILKSSCSCLHLNTRSRKWFSYSTLLI